MYVLYQIHFLDTKMQTHWKGIYHENPKKIILEQENFSGFFSVSLKKTKQNKKASVSGTLKYI